MSSAAITSLARAEWRAVVAATAELLGGAEPGIDCEVVVQADELAVIEGVVSGWRYPGAVSRDDCAGFPGVVFRGTRRRSVKEPRGPGLCWT